MSATRKLRPAADRLAERGLPYEITRPGQFWAPLVSSGDRIPVVAFTDEGVFVGYHPTREDAVAVAKKVARMRGVDAAIAITEKEKFA